MPPNNSRKTSSYIPQRSFARPLASGTPGSTSRQQSAQTAAANVVRGQIDNIYHQGSAAEAAAEPATSATTETQPLQRIQAASTSFSDTSHSSPDSPYDKNHEADRTSVPADQWKRYHSAWQEYYQQYYERYYIGEVYRMRETLETNINTSDSAVNTEQTETPINSDDSFYDLRADLLKNVRTSAVKVRHNRHFIPVLSGGFTLLMFWFFVAGGNQLIFAQAKAYASPGSISPVNVIVDHKVDIPISEEPRLIIPKINVDVPVVYDTSNDQVSQLRAMERGVAWFGIPGARSVPGQIGNTVLSGHSSNDLFDPGDYKFIFARLEQLVEGDTFYVNYLGKRYIYSITKKEVVMPTDVHKLVYDTDKPVMTLITCVPLGTAQKRLLVTAEQINLLSEAKPAPDSPVSSEAEETAMPGNSPSLLGRLFGS